MEAFLHAAAHHIELVIETIAILLVSIGSVEALIGTSRLALTSGASTAARQAVWLNFASWLVAALTFQVAADIVATAIAPTWEDLGKLAATAAIRAFISYFLDRDKERMLEKQEREAASP
jgi:uncharacterized membrane protein